jgi:hypothetical protein
MVALQTLFDPQRAGKLDATVALHIGDDPFTATVRAGTLRLSRGTPPDPDATIEAPPGALAAALWRNGTDVAITGRRRTAERFLTLFPLPQASVSAVRSSTKPG